MSHDWRLTVAETIRRPLFKDARVVAGSRGLARPIRWVHILESADSCQYLNGGELILATGLGFGAEKEKRLAYLSELIRRKAVGLCMELGDYIPRIPEDMLELANHHDFPLIAFHRPVRFVEITQDLHEHLINRQLQALRDLGAYSRSLQQLSLQTQGIQRVLQHFQAAVQTQAFLYTPDGSPQYVPSLPQSVHTEMTEVLRRHFTQIEGTDATVQFFTLTDTKQIVYQPVMAMGHLLAYLGLVLYERQADEYLLLTLDSTVSTLAQILMQKMFAEEQALATESRLFDDLIANRPISEELMRSHLGLTGAGKPPAYYAMLLSFQRHSAEQVEPLPPHDLTAVFRSVLSRLGFRAFIRCTGNRFAFLLVERQPLSEPRRLLDKAMQELERIGRQTLGDGAQIWFGIGRTGKRLVDAGKHLAEAEQALAFSHEAQSPYFADLGLFRLLFHIPHEPVLQNFIHDYLGPLLSHDREQGSQLVHTLRVYLDANLSKQEAAEKLFIHRQTLYHRLERIAECLGDDYAQPHRRLCLEIALRALDWLDKEKNAPEAK